MEMSQEELRSTVRRQLADRREGRDRRQKTLYIASHEPRLIVRRGSGDRRICSDRRDNT